MSGLDLFFFVSHLIVSALCIVSSSFFFVSHLISSQYFFLLSSSPCISSFCLLPCHLISSVYCLFWTPVGFFLILSLISSLLFYHLFVWSDFFLDSCRLFTSFELFSSLLVSSHFLVASHIVSFNLICSAFIYLHYLIYFCLFFYSFVSFGLFASLPCIVSFFLHRLFFFAYHVLSSLLISFLLFSSQLFNVCLSYS